MPCCCMNDFASLSADFTTPHFSADLPNVLMSRIIRSMFLMRTTLLGHDAHCAPLEREGLAYPHSIDMPPHWGEGFAVVHFIDMLSRRSFMFHLTSPQWRWSRQHPRPKSCRLAIQPMFYISSFSLSNLIR